MKLFAFFAPLVLIFAPLAPAEEKPTEAAEAAEPAKDSAPVAPQTEKIVLKSTDRDGLKAAIDKTATVTGKVQRANPWDGGITFLNLEGGFTVVCFKKNYGKFPSPPDQLYARGKTIEVTGKVRLHKDRPEIEITGPDQVKVIADAPAPPPEPAAEKPETEPKPAEEKKSENP